ncbi:protocadherin-10-like [Heptranchias perlo]|uniref:protocadherin-10-like n=1 Tax=Heptranchias perlo TaxID=212740 RepID=UPI003559A289
MRCYKIFWVLKWQLLYFAFPFWDLVSGQIYYSIPEELQPGSFVGNIADDLGLDVKQLSARSFRIVSGARKQYLDINQGSGILFVKERIDREQLCESSPTCVLSLEAVIESPLNLYHVEVQILDVNDNAPSFPKAPFRLEIVEVAAPGARFQLESAHDPDVGTNSLQTYELIPNDYFILDVQTRIEEGQIPFLMLEKPLDREDLLTHQLLLIAKDGGVPPRSSTAQIIILVGDANDNPPVFPQSLYRVSLLENVPKGTLVIKLNATDLDDGPNGEIVYSFNSLASVRARELFDVDSRTGDIRVKGNLDYEESSLFKIKVQAMDKGPYATPAYCDVLVKIIDVNDHAPEVTLTSLSSSIGEDAPAGTAVALISAADQDDGESGQVRCHIPNNLPFKLDSSMKNYYRLLTEQQLDRESIAKYDITITCSDAGDPPLVSKKTIQVEISDINDNAPRFMKPLYTVHVMENNAIGSSISSMTAVDSDLNKNGRLLYSVLETQIQGASVTTYVSINSESGAIFTRRSFDYEELKNFQIQVQAQDSGVPPLTANVTVDITILDQNDNAPVIVHPLPEFGSTVLETISRSAEPGYLVAKVSAIDADSGKNARLSYQIIQATDPGIFTVSPDTGEIWTIRSFGGKDTIKQRLVILVKDNGTPSLSVTMTIILSVMEADTEMHSDASNLSEDPKFASDTSFFLVISLGAISTIFFVVLIILSVKVHKNRNGFGDRNCVLGACRCFEARNSLNGTQKASRNLQILPNYVEVFGGDPLSQSFRYETSSTLDSTKRDFMFPKSCHSSGAKLNVRTETMGNEDHSRTSNPANIVNSEYFGVPPRSSGVSVGIIVDQNDSTSVIVHPLPKYGRTAIETVSRFAEPGYLVAKVSATDADSGQNAPHSYQILQTTDPGLIRISPDSDEIWTIHGIVSKGGTKQRLVIEVTDNGSPPLSATMPILLSLESRDTELFSHLSDASVASGFDYNTSCT